MAALYPVYHLPPISDDLVSCTLLTAACFHHAHTHKPDDSSALSVTPKNALKIAMTFVPELEKLVKVRPDVEIQKQNSWVLWALKRVDMALKGMGEKRLLLEEWRIKHGDDGLTRRTSNA